jgi:hypothetical protein
MSDAKDVDSKDVGGAFPGTVAKPAHINQVPALPAPRSSNRYTSYKDRWVFPAVIYIDKERNRGVVPADIPKSFVENLEGVNRLTKRKTVAFDNNGDIFEFEDTCGNNGFPPIKVDGWWTGSTAFTSGEYIGRNLNKYSYGVVKTYPYVHDNSCSGRGRFPTQCPLNQKVSIDETGTQMPKLACDPFLSQGKGMINAILLSRDLGIDQPYLGVAFWDETCCYVFDHMSVQAHIGRTEGSSKSGVQPPLWEIAHNRGDDPLCEQLSKHDALVRIGDRFQHYCHLGAKPTVPDFPVSEDSKQTYREKKGSKLKLNKNNVSSSSPSVLHCGVSSDTATRSAVASPAVKASSVDVFEVCKEFLVDTGCPNDLVNRAQAKGHEQCIREAPEPAEFATANGKVLADKLLCM